MSSAKIKQFIFLQIFVILLAAAVSCNSKSTDDETEIVVTPALVAVKNFYLQANDSILDNLDSVAFSIDLNTGVIFNADSLPKGTNVSRLLASITFANTMTKAELSFLKDNDEIVTIDYLKNPDDTIDFSYPVTLDVTAQDGYNSFSYQIKVNVHNQEPDSLIWDKLSTASLPSRFESPVAQKTIFSNGLAYSLIEEYNGEFTLSSSSDLNLGNWEKNDFNSGFDPEIESFTATESNFWLLSREGILYISSDGLNWDSTNQNWISILGAYQESVLGIKFDGEKYLHSKYPETDGYIETQVEEEFPIFNSSTLGVVETEWYPKPFAIIACGSTESGNLSSKVWGYDGESWAIINQNDLPALDSPMMARYVVYRDTPYVFSQRELDVWILFGGINENGEMNRSVYMSYNNGVNWSLAPEKMQLPGSIPSLAGADVIVAGYDLTADISEAWTIQENSLASPSTRATYTIDGYDITWVCPYLYIFGGYLDNHYLSTEIWRGVLARLEFIPII